MPQKIYLIGAGAIARRHADALCKLPEEALLFVTDVSPDTLAAFRVHFPQAQTFDELEAMLALPAESDDIAIVATPPSSHFELTCRALESGRHVLCEKPLAMSREEAVKMLELARRINRTLGCCSNRFLGLPTTEKVKNLIGAETLGKLYHLTFVNRSQRKRTGVEYQPKSRWFLEKAKSGGGVLMDWGPYDVTTLSNVLSPVRVEVIHAWTAKPDTHLELKGAPNNVEQHVDATLRYHLVNNAVVEVTYERSACTHGGERSLVELEGSRGGVSWDWPWINGARKVAHTYDLDGQTETSVTTFDSDEKIGPMDKPLFYFYQHVHGRTSLALVDGQAVFNFSCIQAIYEAADTGKPQTVSLEATV